MSKSLTPAQIEERAAAAGLTLAALIERASIAPSTYYRWRNRQSELLVPTYDRLIAAIERAEGT